jgi:CrcB protein
LGRLLLVCLGGAVGSGARYLLASAVTGMVGPGFPWGTLAVNVIGCFAIEVVLQGARLAGLSPLAVLTMTTGVMGGFTTYSAFNNQILDLARLGTLLPALLYFAATVAGCLIAGLLGIAAGQVIFSR